MSVMMQILEEVGPMRRVFCASDYQRAIDYLQELLPFEVYGYTATDEINGWKIPPRSDVKSAKILKDGEVIYDGMHHPLAVICLSTSFRGEVELEELKRHLHYDHRFDDAIPFHFRQQYRSWDREWGFCVTKQFYDGLTPGNYEVVIETDEGPGEMKVIDHTHRGDLDLTFVFVSHLDHPGMMNDDLAGCAVGVELFRRLRERKTKYTYKLLLLQEIIGSEYYLGLTNKGNPHQLFEGLFLEMLGTRTPLALQRSLGEDSELEHAVRGAMTEMGLTFREGAFKEIICNDECVFETYGIPMASLSRYPYPEYHTDRDNMSIIDADALEEAVEIVWKAIDTVESSRLVFKKFDGNICLSNPDYDLYVDPGQPAFGTEDADAKRLRLVMDLIPTLQKPMSIRRLAKTAAVGEDEVAAYLTRWVDKGLIELR